ncbi:carbohydrate-binding module family 14 protein [Primorskyibacter sp. S87]|uniref:carbohydrate-binding module family 14 protein n=1 Tax=Primorskyibacter sp. S87 TaxID=3415126 RepID=UPI003C79FB87
MKIKTLACALTLALVPAIAYASCSGRGHQAQSCAPGTVWDAGSQTCVKSVNS